MLSSYSYFASFFYDGNLQNGLNPTFSANDWLIEQSNIYSDSDAKMKHIWTS